jgi:hypothetical protein
MGSGAAAGLLAQVAFWAMLGIGVAFGEIRWRGCLAFVLLWMGGVFGLPHVSPTAGLLVASYVAALDIALVFIVFKGDVPLS